MAKKKRFPIRHSKPETLYLTDGGGGRSRTDTISLSLDFESCDNDILVSLRNIAVKHLSGILISKPSNCKTYFFSFRIRSIHFNICCAVVNPVVNIFHSVRLLCCSGRFSYACNKSVRSFKSMPASAILSESKLN
jgi:hypothetical protein